MESRRPVEGSSDACCIYVGGSESRRVGSLLGWVPVSARKPGFVSPDRHVETAIAMAHGRAAPAVWAGYWASVMRFIVVVVLSAGRVRVGGTGRPVPFS